MTDLIQLTDRSDVTPALRRGLIDCWTRVTNGDGEAGFPFPPVHAHNVAPVMDALITRLHPHRERLLVARCGAALTGWVALSRDPNPRIAHWGSVNLLQTLPSHRKRGVGTALMRRLHHIAREEMRLERLQLAARGGLGLEHFYERLGWREVGRWPKSVCPGKNGTRDEVIMVLRPL
ncbi:GNAT family N-acetyltransferase [Actinomadura rugatobispora]|uniref:GNAT family N-acetyltransferase n=1 Tax=Actinomadura rugatobispora TaxID=1994 RepID=A0ABW0ZP47_9ACTN|nr:GNAT family N-acetyltransferase [Actinomadura rugatobispora]